MHLNFTVIFANFISQTDVYILQFINLLKQINFVLFLSIVHFF